MKTIAFYLAVLITALFSKTYAQSDFATKINALSVQTEKVISEEKATLTNLIEAVNNQLSFGTITAAEAEARKKQLAEESANRIDARLAEIDAERNALIQAKIEGKSETKDGEDGKSRTFSFVYKSKDSIKEKKGELRTTTQFVFAIGLNNLVTNGSIANSDFRVYKSRFYEWGFTYNTRIVPNSQLYHIKYGLSLQYNDLRPTDNRVFVDNGRTTDLEVSPIRQDSRFRNVNLVIPVHFELDFSPTRERHGAKIFRSHESFRIGLGGYTGFSIRSKQVQRFESNGYETRAKTKGDWNTNDFIYGLSAYAGYGQVSLYAKYDINPLFRNNAIDQRNASLGIRIDFN